MDGQMKTAHRTVTAKYRRPSPGDSTMRQLDADREALRRHRGNRGGVTTGKWLKQKSNTRFNPDSQHPTHRIPCLVNTILIDAARVITSKFHLARGFGDKLVRHLGAGIAGEVLIDFIGRPRISTLNQLDVRTSTPRAKPIRLKWRHRRHWRSALPRAYLMPLVWKPQDQIVPAKDTKRTVRREMIMRIFRENLPSCAPQIVHNKHVRQLLHRANRELRLRAPGQRCHTARRSVSPHLVRGK